MFRVTLKSLLAHKLRLLLTASAVVLGVAFVAGTLILGDTLNKTFDKLFATAYSGTDVGVRGKSAFDVNVADGGDQHAVPRAGPGRGARGGARRRRRPEAAGRLPAASRRSCRPDGKVVETRGAPTLGGTWLGKTPLNPYVLQDGAAPAGRRPGRDRRDHRRRTTSSRSATGIQVLTQTGPLERRRSAGLVSFGDERQPRPARPITLFDPPTAQAAARASRRQLHRGPRRRRRHASATPRCATGSPRCCRRRTEALTGAAARRRATPATSRTR